MFKDRIWVYVAGPYTGDIVQNTRRAILAGEDVAARGFFPVVPHVSMIWDMACPHDAQWWYDYTLELMRRCDAVLRLPGASTGGDNEVAHAKELGIPVFNNMEALVTWRYRDLPIKSKEN